MDTYRRRARHWLLATAALLLTAAAAAAEDGGAATSDTSSTVEASGVSSTNAAASRGNSTDGSDPFETWRTGGFTETPSQIILMSVSLGFLAVLLVIWVCTNVIGISGGDGRVRRAPFSHRQRPAPSCIALSASFLLPSDRVRSTPRQDPEAEAPAIAAAIMAVVSSADTSKAEQKEEVEKLVVRAIECGVHARP